MTKNYKIILKDNSEINCISIFRQNMFIKGSSRDSLTFNFENGDYSIDDLINKFNNENNTSTIKVISLEDEKEYLHFDYSIFNSVIVEDSIINKETNDSAEETITLIKITMGQLSYSEKIQKQQSEQIDDLSIVIADMLGGANNE